MLQHRRQLQLPDGLRARHRNEPDGWHMDLRTQAGLLHHDRVQNLPISDGQLGGAQLRRFVER